METFVKLNWRPISEAHDLVFTKQYLLRVPSNPLMKSEYDTSDYIYEVCTYITDFVIWGKYMAANRNKVEWAEIPE